MAGSYEVLGRVATLEQDMRCGMQQPVAREGQFVAEVVRSSDENEKRSKLVDILEKDPDRGVIYVSNARSADKLRGFLLFKRILAGHIHEKMRIRDRQQVQNQFLNGRFRILIATPGALSTLSNDMNVGFVVHYRLPVSIEKYCQEVGALKKRGKPIRSYLFYQPEDKTIRKLFLGGRYPSHEEGWVVYQAIETIESSMNEQASFRLLAFLLNLNAERIRVIVSLLEHARILDKKHHFRRAQRFASKKDFETVLTAYEKKARQSHKNVESLVRYAQTTLCRTRFINDYLVLPSSGDCGTCDNCRKARVTPSRASLQSVA